MLWHLWLLGMGSCLLWGLLSLAESMKKGSFSYWFGSLAQELQEIGENVPWGSWSIYLERGLTVKING